MFNEKAATFYNVIITKIKSDLTWLMLSLIVWLQHKKYYGLNAKTFDCHSKNIHPITPTEKASFVAYKFNVLVCERSCYLFTLLPGVQTKNGRHLTICGTLSLTARMTAVVNPLIAL